MKKVLLNAMLVGAIAFTACKKDEDKDTPTTPECVETEYDTTSYVDGNDKTVMIVTITDNGCGTGTVTFENTINYVLDGKVYVNSGDELTIEEGTVIKGAAGSGPNASSLIVSNGAKIHARGTAAKPIIFTSTADETYIDTEGTLNYSTELPATSKGLWGGVGILGNGQINEEAPQQFEGTTDERGLYGSASDADNSASQGEFYYVSIKHAGAEIAAGDELNGLGLAGVGSGTEIHHVEILANQDDGIEIWGSTTEIDHCVISFVGDDGLDWDQGWSGSASHIFVIYDQAGGHGGEWDGDDGRRATPFATPTISNVTFVGAGSKYAALFRENAGGSLEKALLVGFADGIGVDNNTEQDSKKRYDDGELTFSDVVVETSGDILFETENEGDKVAAFTDANVTSTTGTGLGISNGTIMYVPTTVPDNGNGYIGAFDGTDNWMAGWTALDKYGML